MTVHGTEPGFRIPEAAIARLREIVGNEHLFASAEDTAPYLIDARRRYSVPAGLVVRPSTTEQVAQIVSCCGQFGIGIVPQGGNTGLSGGSVPSGNAAEIVLALGRMNRIREIDPLNNTMTAEAGVVLAKIQEAAREVGRLFPLSLAAEGSCQIGGNLSTNAGGVNVLRYGNAREQVLGLEVVLPNGRVWHGLRGLRKDNTGYDLKHVFVGAEGTLGIITAAVLRLRPLPSAAATAWAGLADPGAAVALLERLQQDLGERVLACEIISRACVDAVLAHRKDLRDPLTQAYPWYVLVELADNGSDGALREHAERSLENALAEGLVLDVALASSGAQSSALWEIRETIPEAQFRNVKHDISVPVSRVPELLETAGEALERAFPGMLPYAFGHLGDGNIHYNIGMRDPARTEQLMREHERVNELVFEVVVRLGGSISAEHGIGQLRRAALARYKSEVELELMRALKRALDPAGIMNPGKVI